MSKAYKSHFSFLLHNGFSFQSRNALKFTVVATLTDCYQNAKEIFRFLTDNILSPTYIKAVVF